MAKRKTLSFLLKAAFSLAALTLFFLTSKVSFGDIGRTLASVSWAWLAVAFSLHIFGLLFSAYRWRILIRAQGDDVPLFFLVKSYLVGTFFNNFLPTRFGGDVVRIWDGSKYSQSLVRSSAVVLVERGTGIIVLFLFALVASLFRLDMAREVPVIWAALACGLAGLAAVALFFLPAAGRALERLPEKGLPGRFKHKIIAFRAAILQYRKARGAFARATVLAVLLQLNVILYYYLIGQALHLPIGLLDYFIFIPIVLLVQIIPISINGTGLREGAYIQIFKFYRIPAHAASAWSFSIIEVAFGLLVGLVGGIIYLSRK
jgi:uncharacterized protein (TIRG00374 family)